MTTTTPMSASAVIAVTEPVFTGPEQLALAGFLAGYTGLTRDAYALDLRQYASWCRQHHLRLFGARRAEAAGSEATSGVLQRYSGRYPGRLARRSRLASRPDPGARRLTSRRPGGQS